MALLVAFAFLFRALRVMTTLVAWVIVGLVVLAIATVRLLVALASARRAT